uniref:Secreted protein n=1 Tax=Arundo donax TaxID=35708 RepID=A0A0A9CSE1_ARUDO
MVICMRAILVWCLPWVLWWLHQHSLTRLSDMRPWQRQISSRCMLNFWYHACQSLIWMVDRPRGVNKLVVHSDVRWKWLRMHHC